MTRTDIMDLERLKKNLEVLGEWPERYRFIIELGRKLPQLDESQKIEDNRVHGCMSTVYMVLKRTESDCIEFIANSDAAIVNGLIAILSIIYNQKSAQEVRATDIKVIFKDLGLETHISPNRRNGFFAMVGKIQEIAQ